MKKKQIISAGWISFVLIFVLGVVESATDIYIPSMPTLVVDFKTSADAVGLTISVYFFAFCLMGPVYGPLSDALGRRKILITGIFCFTVFSVFCAIATTITSFICFRFLQGLGASVAWVLGLSIVKDLYGPKDSVKTLSMIGAVVAVAPGIAPVLGGYITIFWGWRVIFWIVAGFALLALIFLVFAFEETLPVRKRQRLNLRVAIDNYGCLLRNSRFLAYATISGLMFSGLMANVAIGPFYYIEYLGVSSEKYGYFQMVLVSAYIVGTYVNRKAIQKWRSLFLLGVGLSFALLGAVLLCLLAIYLPNWPWLLTGGMSLYSFGAGIAFSNTSNCALEIFPQAGGTSAAFLGVIEMTLVAFCVWLAGVVYSGAFWPVGIIVLMCVGLSFFLWKKLENT